MGYGFPCLLPRQTVFQDPHANATLHSQCVRGPLASTLELETIANYICSLGLMYAAQASLNLYM